MALVGKTVEEMIYNFLKAQGFTDAGAAGMMGNLYAESGLSSINLQNNGNKKLSMTDEEFTKAFDNGTYTNFVRDSYGYGLAQWTYWSRKQGLMEYAKSKGVSIGDLEMQLEFLMKELNAGYKSLLTLLRTSNSVSECSNGVLLQFERPASVGANATEEQKQATCSKRAGYGQTYYDKFHSKGGTVMGYTNSPLVDCVKLSPNHSGKRTHKIDRITPHCVVGQCSAERIGDCFPAGREASCNYGIGYDGRVCLIVDEANRSWCTSSGANDQRAITIECASDSTDPYAFKDACYKKLVKLCIDICQRNGIKKMLWFNNKEKSLNYAPKDGEGVFTVHRWFANKSCPGNWMYDRMEQLCNEVNAGLNGGTYTPPTPTIKNVNYQAKVTANDGLNCRTEPVVKNGNIVTTFPNGTVLTITQEQDGWGYAGLGWVSLNYVEKISLSPEVNTPVITNQSAIDRLIAIAKVEIGYLEKETNSQLDDKVANAGDNNWTKYARDLDNLGYIYNGKKNGYAWCDMFVDWCFIKTFGVELGMKLLCQEYRGAGAGCTYSAQYYKNKGQFHKSNPKAGDQIFFTNDGGKSSCHTGLVIAVDGNKVYTIEGNTSSAAGVVANGGCVREKSYSLNYANIYGYGRPDWSLVKTVEMEDDFMTKAQILNELGDKYISTYNELPDWAKPDIRELLDRQVINGGTDYATDPDDINMTLSQIKAIIVCKRMIEGK